MKDAACSPQSMWMCERMCWPYCVPGYWRYSVEKKGDWWAIIMDRILFRMLMMTLIHVEVKQSQAKG